MVNSNLTFEFFEGEKTWQDMLGLDMIILGIKKCSEMNIILLCQSYVNRLKKIYKLFLSNSFLCWVPFTKFSQKRQNLPLIPPHAFEYPNKDLRIREILTKWHFYILLFILILGSCYQWRSFSFLKIYSISWILQHNFLHLFLLLSRLNDMLIQDCWIGFNIFL